MADIKVNILGNSESLTAATTSAKGDLASLDESAVVSSETMSVASDKNVESMAKTKAASEGASTGFNTLAIGAVAAGAGVVYAIGKMVKASGDFQEQLTSLVTGAGESESNIGMVSSAILQMAGRLGEGTQQLTSGLFMIESAGFHGAAGLNILKSAAEGAKVGGADLGVVADATTTILKDFGNTLPTQAVNALIATVANGKTHMEDLAQSLSQILPTASSAKVSLNDVMGAMATMTGEGVPAANAATYLRQTILALDAPSSTAQKALKNVGLTTAEVSTTMQQSLPAALQMITEAIGKKFPVGSAAYVAAIKDISGGSKTMQGMLDLTGQHMSDFQSNVSAVTDQVKQGGNSIVGFSKVQQDQNFQTARLKDSLQALEIEIGNKLSPYITEATKVGANFLEGIMSLTKAIQKHWDGIKEVIKVLAPLIAGILAVAAAVKTWQLIITMINTVKAAWIGLQAAFAANPIVLIAMGVAAVALLVITHWNDVKHWFDDFMNWIKGHWQDLLGILLGPIIGPIALIIANWHRVVDFFGGLKNMILGALGDVGSWLFDAGKSVIQGLINGLDNMVGAVENKISSITSGIKNVAKKVLGIFSPSTVFADIGQNVGQGLIQGIQGTQAAVSRATGNLATAAIHGASAAPGLGAMGAPVGSGMAAPGAAGGAQTTIHVAGNVMLNTAEAVQEFFAMQGRNVELTSMGMTPMMPNTGGAH